MAIWQFSFKVIPQEKVKKKYKNIPTTINDGDIDLVNNWNGHSLSDKSIDDILKILEPSKSWSNDIKQFGQLEETCMELFYNKGILEEVSIRLDLRSINYVVLEAIVNFINLNDGLILLDESSNLLNPSIETLVYEIKKSDAYLFVKNPNKFLESLS